MDDTLTKTQLPNRAVRTPGLANTANPDNGENQPSQPGCFSAEEEEEMQAQEMEVEGNIKYEKIIDTTPLTQYNMRKHERVYQLKESMNYIIQEIENMKHTKFQETLDLNTWIKRVNLIKGQGNGGKTAESMIANLTETNAYLTRRINEL